MYYIHANQNSHEKSPPTGQNGHHLKYLQRIWAAEDGGKWEFSYTLGGVVNGCRNYQKQQGGSLSDKHPETTWLDNPRSGLRARKISEFTVTHAPLFSGQLY